MPFIVVWILQTPGEEQIQKEPTRRGASVHDLNALLDQFEYQSLYTKSTLINERHLTISIEIGQAKHVPLFPLYRTFLFNGKWTNKFLRALKCTMQDQSFHLQ